LNEKAMCWEFLLRLGDYAILAANGQNCATAGRCHHTVGCGWKRLNGWFQQFRQFNDTTVETID